MITTVDFESVNVADQERAKRFYTDFHAPKAAGGMTPFVFDTDDIVGTCRDLEARGVEIVDRPAIAPWGSWWAQIRDSEGNSTGLNQKEGDE